MLSDKEIEQFHRKGVVVREGLFAGRAPFAVRTFSVGDNVYFAKQMDRLDAQNTDQRISNFVALTNIERALVMFNNARATPETSKSFTPPKCNYILNTWNDLCKDLLEYLGGYQSKPLDNEEIEEYIFSDKIVRTERLEWKDGVPPITFSYRVISIHEHEEVHSAVKITPEMRRWHLDALTERQYALKVIQKINGTEITSENIEDFNTELVGFILRRAVTLEKEANRLNANPEEMSERLKKS